MIWFRQRRIGGSKRRHLQRQFHVYLRPASAECLEVRNLLSGVSTSFEGISSTNFTIGSESETARFVGDAFSGILGISQLYRTGSFAWMVNPPGAGNGVGTVTFATPASSVSFWARLRSNASGGSMVITAFDPQDNVIDTATFNNPAASFRLVQFSGTIARMEFVNSTNQMTSIDDFGFCVDTRGITVSAINRNTTEAGGTATFTVVLDTQPTANVSIGLSSSNTAEGTVTSTPLTFTTSNWNQAQTVTVTGVDDDVDDGNIAYSIIMAPAVGGDYAGLNADDVAVTNTDDDEVGFSLSKTTAIVSETGTSDSFTVVLDAEPDSDVVMTVASGDTGEATVGIPSLTFTSTNWDQPQTVTITGVNDNFEDGNQMTMITLSIDDSGSDDAFDSLADQQVTVTTIENTGFSLDVDGDGESSPLTDGILTIRYLAGFIGDSLVAGAVNISGIRTDGPSVIAWLDPHRSTFLDVDGDGASTALTDGILMIRYLAGFRGAALIDGAVNQNGTRTTAVEVEAWIEQFSGGGSGSGPVASGPLPRGNKTELSIVDAVRRYSIPQDDDTHGQSEIIRADWRASLPLTGTANETAKSADVDELDLVFHNLLGLDF